MSTGPILGSDTGGTFTDLVDGDGAVTKILSTPADPGSAVREGVRRMADGRAALLAHGTTVATNALLERKGAATALVTDAGLEDVIEIGRQDRPSLYDPFADRPEPLVPRRWRFGVPGRTAADGTELAPVDAASLPTIPAEVDAVAVVLLHADLDPTHEKLVATALRERGLEVSASHEVSSEFREYERTVTTVVNASLRPVCRSYLAGLSASADEVLVMTSAGGLVPIGEAGDLPASLLLSGPAGGVRAAAASASANGFVDAVTFDMGGTSTDVCLVLGGEPAPAGQRVVAGLPIRFPSLDVHTVGAGGGSIAQLDAGGALTVGPESAGADPGPACYGRGGTRPTVTDANLVAGRLGTGIELAGLGVLDVDAARRALDGSGVTAEGVLAVVNAGMEKALRVVSVERGVDPRRLALVAFGGAGPLHACDLADALGMTTVIVPPRAGVLSAVGLLCAPRQREVVASWATPASTDGLSLALAALADRARGLVGPDAVVETSLDCRYVGQSHELTVAALDAFPEEHERRNGYHRPDTPVEVVALRARASRPAALDVLDLPAPQRTAVAGQAVVTEPDCTIWVPDGWVGEPGVAGALVLRRAT